MEGRWKEKNIAFYYCCCCFVLFNSFYSSSLVLFQSSLKNKEYKKAASLFTKLEEVAEYKENYAEAIGSAMRAYMNLNDTTAIAAYAQKIIAYEKSASDDINLAHLYLGKLYYKQKNNSA